MGDVDSILGVNLVLQKSVANPQPPVPTTTMHKSTPPSKTLTRRLRALITNLDNASVDSTAKQVCGWINSFKTSDDRFRGLLRLIAELVLEEAVEKSDRDSHHVLVRLCKTVDTATDGEHSRFLNLLWEEELQAVSVELLANNTAEAGCWPECISLVAFAGELCSNTLLRPDALRSCARALSGSGSNLSLAVTCTLLEVAGQPLCRDREGKDFFDTVIQTMLLRDGIPAHIRRRVQALTVQWIPEGIPGNSSKGAQWDEETVHSDDDEEHLASQAASHLCKPRHHKFYFGSGDLVFVCEDISFRVQSEILTNNSQVFSDMLDKAHANGDHISDGCPCIHLSDAAEDFATFLKVFYTSGFPHRHKTPDFATFSALLRMTTKYQLEETRSQILLDLLPAYPTELSKYQNTSCCGEAIFGTPLPHPNSVLDLLVRCKVAFALPFAYYRVCVAGDPASLDTSTDGVALSPETLKTALRGQARLKEGEMQFAKKLAFQECTAWKCMGKSRAEVYAWIVPNMVLTNGILERGNFPGSGYCYQCMQAFPQELTKAKEEAWKDLPSYFDLPPWDDVAYQFDS